MFIPDPGSKFLPIPDFGSRIPDPTTATKEEGKKLVVLLFSGIRYPRSGKTYCGSHIRIRNTEFGHQTSCGSPWKAGYFSTGMRRKLRQNSAKK
jgi:hypothetical protein